MNESEDEFKTRYRKELLAVIDECLIGTKNKQAVILVHDSLMQTISMYSVNADAGDALRIVSQTLIDTCTHDQSSGSLLN